MTTNRSSRSFAVAGSLLLMLTLTMASAQMRLGADGHSLDANMQLGSGGYNYAAGSFNAMNARKYFPGASKPLYATSSAGGLVYQPYNAFNPNTPYTTYGYRTNARVSPAYPYTRYP